MSSSSTSDAARPDDSQLWLMAFGISILVNLGLLVALGLLFLRWDFVATDEPVPVPEQAAVATIYIQAIEPEVAAVPKEAAAKRFTRTSPDQEASPVEKTDRIGERRTRATSDRAPNANAALLPSQDGVEPRDGQDIETTESDYQDGALSPSAELPPAPAPVLAPPLPEVAPSPERTLPASDPVVSSVEGEGQSPPKRERLLEGPNPVDVQVPRGEVVEEALPPSQPKLEKPLRPEPVVEPAPPVADAIKPSPVRTESFSGFQRKTAVVGSITRAGRSALNVDDSELGKYQAKVSRAVEQEWRRNCVRHRDFITPGFLTVRFFVEGNGKVRSVQFVGDMETGEVQKGFTLNSIRDAEIPEMPQSLKEAYEGDSLELLFRFYF